MSVLSRVMLRALSTTALLVAGFTAGWISAIYLGGNLPFGGPLPGIAGPGVVANRATPAALREQFSVFWQVWDLLESQYYGRNSLNTTRMIQGAVRGMLASLDDQYTVYQEPDLAAQTNEHMQGKLGGVGTYLRITDGHAYLYKPIKNGPAWQAGLKQDDEIVAIDGEEVAPLIAGLEPGEASVKVAAKIRGQEGTTVTLTIHRAVEGDTIEVTLTRKDVVVPSVEAQMFEEQIAYLRISEFKSTTTTEFDQALRELLPQKPKGIILDLRNNPGGYLQNAQEVLGRFYNGIALYEEDGNGSMEELPTLAGDGSTNAFELPIIVLVNGGSASASEIVAGALRDQRASTYLIGEKTYGKGSVQSIHQLRDGGSARITIAHWLTPNKSIIHAVGITPQFVVPYAEDANSLGPCVAERQPPAGQTLCADSQLKSAVRLLTTGEQPQTPAATK